MANVRASVIIRGRVQGVWFRASMEREASHIGVFGWVRNLAGGEVEALVEGDKKKVEQILAWCHQGPPGARVNRVDVSWEPYVGEYNDFTVRHGW